MHCLRQTFLSSWLRTFPCASSALTAVASLHRSYCLRSQKCYAPSVYGKSNRARKLNFCFGLKEQFCLVVRVPGCRPRSPGFDSRRYQIFLRSIGFGTRSTKPREEKLGATWKKRYRLRSRELRLTDVEVPPRWLRDTLLSAKVTIKIRRPVAAAQSV
jgi:hypothetical protein